MTSTVKAMEHTPGPWIVRNADDYAVYEGGDNPHTIATPDGFVIANVSLQSKSTQANVRLIAAAPELLAALKGLVAWADLMGGWEATAWVVADAAIAKAVGEKCA